MPDMVFVPRSSLGGTLASGTVVQLKSGVVLTLGNRYQVGQTGIGYTAGSNAPYRFREAEIAGIYAPRSSPLGQTAIDVALKQDRKPEEIAPQITEFRQDVTDQAPTQTAQTTTVRSIKTASGEPPARISPAAQQVKYYESEAVKITIGGQAKISPDIATISVSRGSRGGKDFLLVQPVTSAGKVFGEGIGIGGLKKITQGYEVLLPDKEQEIQKTLDESFTQYGTGFSKSEFTNLARPQIEAEYEQNVNNLMTSAEFKGEFISRFRGRAIFAEEILINNPSGYLRQNALLRKNSLLSDAEYQLSSRKGQYIQTPIGSYRNLGLTLAGASVEEKRQAAKEEIATMIAQQATYKEEPIGIQYIKGLAGTFSLGLYQPESPRASFASNTPFAQLPAIGAESIALGAGFANVPVLVSGGIRGAGIPLGRTLLGLGKGAQLVAGLGGVGYTGYQAYNLEAVTIPQIEARGAQAGEVVGLRSQFYSSLLVSTAGGLYGGIKESSYLAQPVEPTLIRGIKGTQATLTEFPEGKLFGKGYELEVQVGRTRGQVMAKSPQQTVRGVGEFKGLLTVESDLSAIKVVDTKFRIPRGEVTFGKGSGAKTSQIENVYIRKGDVETATIRSLVEYPPSQTGLKEPVYSAYVVRAGTQGVSGERAISIQGKTGTPNREFAFSPQQEEFLPIKVEKFTIQQRGGLAISDTANEFGYTGISTKFAKISFRPKEAQPTLIRNPAYGAPNEAPFVMSNSGKTISQLLPKATDQPLTISRASQISATATKEIAQTAAQAVTRTGALPKTSILISAPKVATIGSALALQRPTLRIPQFTQKEITLQRVTRQIQEPQRPSIISGLGTRLNEITVQAQAQKLNQQQAQKLDQQQIQKTETQQLTKTIGFNLNTTVFNFPTFRTPPFIPAIPTFKKSQDTSTGFMKAKKKKKKGKGIFGFIEARADIYSRSKEEFITGRPARNPVGSFVSKAYEKEFLKGGQFFPTARQIKTGTSNIFRLARRSRK